MISDVNFDLAGTSAVAAISPNGWLLATVRHGVAIDFFDARDLCSSNPSALAEANSIAEANAGNHPSAAAASAAASGGATRHTTQRSRARKLGALKGSFSTLDDVSAIVWSPDSSMLAACMVSRGVVNVISAISFTSIATIEGALNGTTSHIVWHPSSRALYWFGLAQTHVMNLVDASTMILDYHAKVVVDPNADSLNSSKAGRFASSSATAEAGGNSGSNNASNLPLWKFPNDPCPSHTCAGSVSPTSGLPLICFSNGDGGAAEAILQNSNNNNQQQERTGENNNNSKKQALNHKNANVSANTQSNQHNQGVVATTSLPPLFLCMISPCSVAAGPTVADFRSSMNQMNNSSNVNISSAQSVASTTNILEEAASVKGAALNSKINVTTEYFHVFSSVTHEHCFHFPIKLTSSSGNINNTNNNNENFVETGCEFSVTSFNVSPFFIAFHDSFSSLLAVFNHHGENIGPNKKQVVAFSVSAPDCVDGGSTISMIHHKSFVSVFSSCKDASSPLVQMFSVNLAKPQSYLGFFPSSSQDNNNNSNSNSSSSAAAVPPLVVLAERIASDDLLERGRNEGMTEKASLAHHADPSRTLPVAPPNRSMYEVLLPSNSNSNSSSSREQSTELFAPGNPLTLIPGLRGKAIDAMCHDPKNRCIIEQFVKHTMRKTDVRNMMDDIVSTSAFKNNNSNNNNQQQKNKGGLRGSSINTAFTSTTTSSFSSLSTLSSQLLSEIAPLAFQQFGMISMNAFHSTFDHSNPIYIAAVVPLFPTVVWIIDASVGKVVSCLQQEHVITTLQWKPPRDVLPNNNNSQFLSSSTQGRSSNNNNRKNQQQQSSIVVLDDPILAFTTDSHIGVLYLWTPESALCVAMPEITKVVTHQNSKKSITKTGGDVGEENFNCKLHVACSDPNCRRNWLEKQKEVDRRRKFERGELGGFRTTCAAWTDAGNSLFMIDTIRGSHCVASLKAQ